MASYFNSGSDTDTALLHSSVRSHAELANVSSDVEADVLEAYTLGADASSRTVYLNGYESDADDADTALRDALRRTIAEVTSHRLRYYDDDATASMVVRGARTVARGGRSLDPLWPPGWRRRLRSFSTLPPPAYL